MNTKTNKNRLFLILKNHWYQKIKSGEKRIEYRQMTPFWKTRIWEKREILKTITFQRGYSNAASQMIYQISKIVENPKIGFYEIHFL